MAVVIDVGELPLHGLVNFHLPPPRWLSNSNNKNININPYDLVFQHRERVWREGVEVEYEASGCRGT